jgi:hypothetical protein
MSMATSTTTPVTGSATTVGGVISLIPSPDPRTNSVGRIA